VDGQDDERASAEVNMRQANGLGRVHVAKPRMKETYCGRPVTEEDWLITSREANCTGCVRAGAPRPERPGRNSSERIALEISPPLGFHV
jgi:hypothetical protein